MSFGEPADVGAATCEFLRRRHPRLTALEVAADLSPFPIKATTIAKMLERESTPGTPLLLALACAYGPEFLAEVLPAAPPWLDAAVRAERRAALLEQMREGRQGLRDTRRGVRS